MKLNELKDLAAKHMKNRKAHLEREKGFTYYHGLRVSKLSLKLRKAIIPEDNSHDDILAAASMFHDVAKGIEPHGKYGSILVEEMLKDYCSDYELGKLSELIYYHSERKDDNDYSDYIKILQDADLLDHFGTSEIWINFQYYAHTEGSMEDSIKFYDDEYKEHVKNCRKQLNYHISRKIFDDKVEFVNFFVDRFKKEAEGEFVIDTD